jgi:hypothetical protein
MGVEVTFSLSGGIGWTTMNTPLHKCKGNLRFL